MKHPGVTRRSARLLVRACMIVLLAWSGLTAGASDRSGRDISDMNRDGRVDQYDLILFSLEMNQTRWELVNWCEWLEENENIAIYQQYRRMFAYIRDRFKCGPSEPDDPLAVENSIRYPTRMALGPDGIVYLTDAMVGSVFLFEPEVSLVDPLAEIKGFERPLGIVVTTDGDILVGDHDLHAVLRCTAGGTIEQAIGEAEIRMPSDLAMDREGNLYVADSESNVIWVYDEEGELLRVIRSGGLSFPTSVRIQYPDEIPGVPRLYVGDKGNYLVKVFDLNGNFIREFGGFPIKSGMMGTSWDWEGRFMSIQDLVSGSSGNLFVLDGYMVNIQEISGDDGTFVRAFGEKGSGPGQMLVPIDLLILPGGELLVSDAVNRRLELVGIIQ